MVQDHTKAGKELQALASKKGVKLPASPDRGHEKDLKELEKLSGAEFDREYMAKAGVKDHDRTVDLFRDAKEDTKDPDVKAFIDKTLPVLQKHHQMAKTLHASVKDGKSSAVGAGKGERKRPDRDAK
jgi:putative membrane protein